ncbi:MAG: hypothetical protein HZA20_05540 [Nitrospirae bacterium]|nr:hypothetical protein [Nitrospirota bacterium]
MRLSVSSVLRSVAVLAALASCASVSLYDEVKRGYPPGEYIVGVGETAATGDEAADRRVAGVQARRDIAEQIRVRIESVMIDEACSGGTDGNCRNRVTLVAKTSANEILVNSRIDKTGQRENTVWAAAIIERNETDAALARARGSFAKTPPSPFVQAGKIQPRGVVRGVKAEGACAVVGMTAEQARLTALQRARQAAIEQASGVRVDSSAVVTEARLAVDFIRTYSSGYIVEEDVTWLPLGQYQRDSSSPPIPEYRVSITATVRLPEKKIKPLGLAASLNGSLFRAGEAARIAVSTERPARIAVFNIMADDRVAMIFPTSDGGYNIMTDGKNIVTYPSRKEDQIVIANLPGHTRDAEAFFIVAMDAGHEGDFVATFGHNPMEFKEFFKRYAGIADNCEDAIFPYEVVGKP